MINRRAIVFGSAIALFATNVAAQDWKAKYPELVMALVPAENATGVLARVGPFADYLTRELGVSGSTNGSASAASTKIRPRNLPKASQRPSRMPTGNKIKIVSAPNCSDSESADQSIQISRLRPAAGTRTCAAPRALEATACIRRMLSQCRLHSSSTPCVAVTACANRQR